MFRTRKSQFSRGLALAGAGVLAVTTSMVLTTTAARSPVSASGPDASRAIVNSSTAVAPVTTRSAATETTDTPATRVSTPAPVPALDATQPSVTPAPDPAPEAPRLSADSLITGRVMWATESVNVRDTPGTDGAVVAVLSSGQSITAGEDVAGWVPIHSGDTYGWASSHFLADGTPPAETPAPQPEPASSGNWMTDLIPQVDPGGAATWVFERNGSWGASDGHTIYIDPDVPSSKRFSVLVHEYSHVLQVQAYGSLNESVAAMSALIGGSPSDVTANERAADCMALMLGATWVNYGCDDSLRAAAAAILAGHRP